MKNKIDALIYRLRNPALTLEEFGQILEEKEQLTPYSPIQDDYRLREPGITAKQLWEIANEYAEAEKSAKGPKIYSKEEVEEICRSAFFTMECCRVLKRFEDEM
jgi:hypothetical protein